jgi:hypothetical protein
MKAKVTFNQLNQDTQDLAASDPDQNHMISRAFFTLEVGGKQYADMSVTLRQPFGTDYAKEPIEVEKPAGSYKGNWNHNDFRDAVEDYYRSAIGSGGSGIRVGAGSTNIRMRDNKFVFSKTYEFDIPD